MPGPWAVAPAYYGYGGYYGGYHNGPMSRPGLYGGGF
jgi:hypothetical protein